MLNKKTYNYFLFPITVVLLILFLTISRLYWGIGDENPEVFSDVWETISGLGNMEHNPKGFFFFQIWGTLFGVFILHVTRYIHDRMIVYKDYPIMFLGKVEMFKDAKPIELFGGKFKITFKSEDLVKLGTFFLLAGGIGFILMGLIPDGLIEGGKLHETNAGIGFGGIMFASFCYSNVLDHVAKSKGVNKKLHITLKMMWTILILGVAITYPIAELYFKEKYDLGWYDPEWGEAGVPFIFSFSVWERYGFIVGCAYVGLLGWLLPEKPATKSLEQSE